MQKSLVSKLQITVLLHTAIARMKLLKYDIEYANY